MKHFYLALLLVSPFAFAQIPGDYYDTATGSGYTLKTQLKTIITAGHVDRGYSTLYIGYQTTDNDSFYEDDDTVLDMYSEDPAGADPYNFAHDTNGGTAPGDACGGSAPTAENDCYNREHLFPQGFFNSATPMRSDVHHVVPSDGYVNSQRGNLPFGEVSSPDWTSSNGSKRGPNTYPGYVGDVFEPIDEFKGDIARMMLYFAVRYEDEVTDGSWDPHTDANNPLNGTNDQVYEDWYINLLYDWHVADPVSAREITRNMAAYNYQGNANPFVDHPEFVLSIWGSLLSDKTYEQTPDVILYPNPVSSDLLYISTTRDLEVDLYDVLGKLVLKATITPAKNYIRVSNLNKGIYLLKLNSDKQTITKKLIRQ
jgi:endonuclease I